MPQQNPFDGGDLIRHLVELSRALSRSLQPTFEVSERVREQMRQLVERLPPMENIQENTRRIGEAIRDTFQRALPDNWHELDAREATAAVALGMDRGINVVWAPRAEIIRELLDAADDDARVRVLVDREADILDDIELVLAEATHDSFGHLPDLSRKALAAHRDGHREAAHALAAAVLTGVVHENFGFNHLAAARERFQRDHPMHVEMSLLRLTAILHTLGRALHRTDVAPPGFNRHGSLHALAAQYTPANAVAALLLVAGVLRELDVVLAAQDEEDERDAA